MRVRYEPWGAWVRTERPPALVALDREGARCAGLDGGGTWTGAGVEGSPPLEAHVAVTSRCGVGCDDCYLDATSAGEHVPLARLYETIDALAGAGAFAIALGGGEPLLRDDLELIAERASARGLIPVVTTSGIGLTAARAARLRAFAQVNVSYDGEAGTYEAVRGVRGARQAERAIAVLAAAGVRTGVNVVLTRQSFPELGHTLDRARACGAIEAQLLRYKPAGRAKTLDYFAKRLSIGQVDAFASVVRAYCARPQDERLRLRIDCALVPFLSTDETLAGRTDDLVRFGVFGCEAGRALCAVRADGRVAGCSFAPPGAWFGAGAVERDAGVARLREWSDAPEGACAACPLARACRGGCKIVSTFLDPNAHGPDPECPRARAERM